MPVTAPTAGARRVGLQACDGDEGKPFVLRRPPERTGPAVVQGHVDSVVAFFFEAEDGIRGLTVTGVQTCALPIFFPTGIYTIPEVGCVGETEGSLKGKKVDFVVGKVSYTETARGEIIGDRAGFLKLLFSKPDLKLLGAHAIGEQATELVHLGL